MFYQGYGAKLLTSLYMSQANGYFRQRVFTKTGCVR